MQVSGGGETMQSGEGLAQMQRVGEEAVGYCAQTKSLIDWH